MQVFDTIFCIVGESGSGKTEIAKVLYNAGVNVIQSYTTRKPRHNNEWGHIFSTYNKFLLAKSKKEVIAETYFAGNWYWAEKNQYQGFGNTIYVIDVHGVNVLKQTIKDANIVVLYISATEENRFKRMVERYIKDNPNLHNVKTLAKMEAKRRIEHDRQVFKNFSYDYIIDNNQSLEKAINTVMEILRKHDSKNTLHI